MTELRVRIERDDEYNARPGDNISWPDDPQAEREYVAEFERGEITAYGVIIERECDMDEWHHVDSVWGVDVRATNQEGIYTNPANISDEHLRETAEEMWIAQLAESTP